MSSTHSGPRCHAPWQTMLIDAAGFVNPCAYRNNYNNLSDCGPCGNLNESSLEEIWNGEEYRKLRENMAKGDLAAAGCANCLALKQKQPLELQCALEAEEEDPPVSAYAQNMRLKRQEIRQGATKLRSKPTVVYYTPTHRCNLRCTHCYQDAVRTQSLVRKDADQEVLDLLPVIDQIVAGGGEPLLLPIWRKFIDQADLAVNPYLQFATTTNATVIPDSMIEGLRRFYRLALTVSVDGVTKGVFEKIRLKGNFETVVENMDRLIELAETHPRAVMSVTFSVMKDNILQLPDLVKFCAEHQTTYNLLPVLCYPADLSLRTFNDPHTQMAGWREAIQAGREALEEFLIRPGRIDPGMEDVYRSHYSALEENIPWEILDLPHIRFRGTVPEYYFDEFKLAPLDQHLQVGFYPVHNGVVGDCRYYADVEKKRRFKISLAPGEYMGTLFARNKPPSNYLGWKIWVGPDGQVAGMPTTGEWDWTVLSEPLTPLTRRIVRALRPVALRERAKKLAKRAGLKRFRRRAA